MATNRTRRGVLAAAGTGLAGALAGCTGVLSTGDDGADHPTGGFPLRERSLHVADEFERLNEFEARAAPKDRIPSIDDPRFEPASEVGDRVFARDPVFGIDVDGDARAYPQSILVWHEIVNDVVGDVPVAVTYCPLTGSVLAVYRGETTFGTTGKLLNSNLVMYDRTTESEWPQVLGTAIEGEHRGDSLAGLPITWTTFERWTEEYPDSRVLTRDTGYVRNYDRDPYGMYNPKGGYYATDGQLYDPLRDPGRTPPKLVVVAARTPSGSFAASKKRLRDEHVVAGTAGDAPVVAVYDPALDTGYVYERPSETAIEVVDEAAGTYRVDGETAGAADLPLDRIVDFDVMWFAWNAFYPEGDAHV